MTIGQKLRALLGLDLSGKLSAWRRRYKNSLYRFDHRDVRCSVAEWNSGTSTASACSYCNDPFLSGFDISPVIRFYRSAHFDTQADAYAHLEAEVRRATRVHPETKFYLTREVELRAGPNGEIIPVCLTAYCLNGIWQTDVEPPSLRRCEACGYRTDADTSCPRCGEPILW